MWHPCRLFKSQCIEWHYVAINTTILNLLAIWWRVAGNYMFRPFMVAIVTHNGHDSPSPWKTDPPRTESRLLRSTTIVQRRTSLPHNTSLPEFNTYCRSAILVYCQIDIIRAVCVYIYIYIYIYIYMEIKFMRNLHIVLSYSTLVCTTWRWPTRRAETFSCQLPTIV